MSSDEESSDDYADERAVIIENGSCSMKAGFAGDEDPCDVFPTITGHPKCKSMMTNTKDCKIGDSAQALRGILNINRPVQSGLITDWDNMEKIWHHVLNNGLRVIPEEHNVHLIDKSGDQDEREKMAEIMFEEFEINGLWFSLQSVMALYACGKNTGIVLDSGYETTNVTPIYEGKVAPHTMRRLDFGGKHMTEYLIRLTGQHDDSTISASKFDTWNEMKENVCHVSQYTTDGSLIHETSKKDYELPSGEVIAIEEEQFKTTEALFDPNLLGLEDVPGIHTVLNESILKSFNNPVPNHYSLYNNIILCGGNTMFKGIQKRLTHELRQIIPISMQTRVISSPKRIYYAWRGGSMFASTDEIKEKWITRKEFEEQGSGTIKQKCS